MSDPPLNQERQRRAAEIVDRLQELLPVEQASFLDAACAGDQDLREQVRALLSSEPLAYRNSPDHAEEPTSSREALPSTPTPLRSFSSEGSRLGPYRLGRRIGSGGFGVVYEAEDTRLGRKVAIKLLPSKEAVGDRSYARFLREARAVSALDHPNICSIHDIGQSEDGRFYIVMAYYAGETLAEKLRKGPLPVDEVRDLAFQLAQGLKHAHDAGITHRDIKPANLIVTDDRQVKILDFGLAKVAGEANLTRTGGRPGTPAYMSPEQLRGKPVDRRTDIWSFGVVLYEMLAGRHPFRREDPAAVMPSILESDPDPLGELRERLPEGLVRTLNKALAKHPAERYRSVDEVLADLSGSAVPEKLQAREQRRRWIKPSLALTAALLPAAVGALLLLPSSNPERDSETAVGSRGESSMAARERPSLAVLYFQNLTGAAELDWLRSGMTDMLVADLSQSPEIHVLSTAVVYQSLQDNRMLDEATISFDRIRSVAKDVGASAVVRGSYARVGEVLRISFTIEDAEDGTILRSDRVEGRGEESLFSMVDEVVAAIRNTYEITRPAASPPTVAAATTSSLEAWRLYSEGNALYQDLKTTEAIALLERAVEIDPGFAPALANLGTMHATVGHDPLARDYMRRALEFSDRLPLDERYRIEGTYYASRWATFGRGIEIYEEGLSVYPEQEPWRNNLARRYAFLERYEEAIREFDVLIANGTTFTGDYFDAANAHAALGQFEAGYQLLSAFAKDKSDKWFVQYALGWYLTEWDRLQEAEARFQNAAVLRPGEYSIAYARWRLEVLGEDWESADRAAHELASFDDPFARWRANVSLARNELYRGRAGAALARFDDAAHAYREPNAYTALAQCWKAGLLLETGEPERALEEAQLARMAGVDEWPERKAMFVLALAHQALGRPSDADSLVRELEQMWLSYPNNVEERQLHHLRGLLALARDDPDGAVEALRQAAALLSPRRRVPLTRLSRPPARLDRARRSRACRRSRRRSSPLVRASRCEWLGAPRAALSVRAIPPPGGICAPTAGRAGKGASILPPLPRFLG